VEIDDFSIDKGGENHFSKIWLYGKLGPGIMSKISPKSGKFNLSPLNLTKIDFYLNYL